MYMSADDGYPSPVLSTKWLRILLLFLGGWKIAPKGGRVVWAPFSSHPPRGGVGLFCQAIAGADRLRGTDMRTRNKKKETTCAGPGAKSDAQKCVRRGPRPLPAGPAFVESAR